MTAIIDERSKNPEKCSNDPTKYAKLPTLIRFLGTKSRFKRSIFGRCFILSQIRGEGHS